MGLSNKLSCKAGIFSCCLNPHTFFQSDFEALFPHTGTLGWVVCLNPRLFPPNLSTCECWTDGSTSRHLNWSSSHRIAVSTFHPGCPCPPLLPVWMDVSSLTPWLSDFYTVWFSGSSGCFLFLNLLLSFFWLCEEVKSMYLCLHLGWKLYLLYLLFQNVIYFQ